MNCHLEYAPLGSFASLAAPSWAATNRCESKPGTVSVLSALALDQEKEDLSLPGSRRVTLVLQTLKFLGVPCTQGTKSLKEGI
eukprot:1151750-Pelagomonas_calceolata.AAC.14